MIPIEFGQIQGNTFGGFNKDHAVFILLRIKPGKVAAARQTFARAELFKDTAASASDSVMRFNNQFRALRKAGVPHEPRPVVPRPDPRGQYGPDEGGREIRVSPRL